MKNAESNNGFLTLGLSFRISGDIILLNVHALFTMYMINNQITSLFSHANKRTEIFHDKYYKCMITDMRILLSSSVTIRTILFSLWRAKQLLVPLMSRI